MENSEWASVPKNVSLLWGGSAVLTIVTFYFCFTLAAYYFYISFYRTLWCFGPVNGNMQAIVLSCFALGLIYLYPRLGGENCIFNFSYSTIENLYIMSLIVQGIEHWQ